MVLWSVGGETIASRWRYGVAPAGVVITGSASRAVAI